jgi:hypothetical protein
MQHVRLRGEVERVIEIICGGNLLVRESALEALFFKCLGNAVRTVGRAVILNDDEVGSSRLAEHRFQRGLEETLAVVNRNDCD